MNFNIPAKILIKNSAMEKTYFEKLLVMEFETDLTLSEKQEKSWKKPKKMRPEKKKVFNKFYYNAQYYICRYA